jgi:hypothetical protein
MSQVTNSRITEGPGGSRNSPGEQETQEQARIREDQAEFIRGVEAQHSIQVQSEVRDSSPNQRRSRFSDAPVSPAETVPLPEFIDRTSERRLPDEIEKLLEVESALKKRRVSGLLDEFAGRDITEHVNEWEQSLQEEENELSIRESKRNERRRIENERAGRNRVSDERNFQNEERRTETQNEFYSPNAAESAFTDSAGRPLARRILDSTESPHSKFARRDNLEEEKDSSFETPNRPNVQRPLGTQQSHYYSTDPSDYMPENPIIEETRYNTTRMSPPQIQERRENPRQPFFVEESHIKS